jgi:hypothetical protein
VTGPPKKAAFDNEGNPTKAALGFAAKNGLSVDQLQVLETPKGEYLYFKRRTPGRPTIEVLAEILPKLVADIPWPKSMRWGEPVLLFCQAHSLDCGPLWRQSRPYRGRRDQERKHDKGAPLHGARAVAVVVSTTSKRSSKHATSSSTAPKGLRKLKRLQDDGESPFRFADDRTRSCSPPSQTWWSIHPLSAALLIRPISASRLRC